MHNFRENFLDSFHPEELHQKLHNCPFHFKGVAFSLIDSFGIEEIDRMITIQGIGHPGIFLLNSKKEFAHRSFFSFSDTFLRLYSPAKVLQQFIQSGTTILLFDLHKHHPLVSVIYSHFKTFLPHLDKMVCFLSPPESQATMPHADDHPNLVLQVSGAKRWLVWDKIDEQKLINSKSVSETNALLQSQAERDKPLIDCILEPGDLLVVPQRFLHTAKTTDQHSLSIVFQIRCCDLNVLSGEIMDQVMYNNNQHEFVSVI